MTKWSTSINPFYSYYIRQPQAKTLAIPLTFGETIDYKEREKYVYDKSFKHRLRLPLENTLLDIMFDNFHAVKYHHSFYV